MSTTASATPLRRSARLAAAKAKPVVREEPTARQKKQIEKNSICIKECLEYLDARPKQVAVLTQLLELCKGRYKLNFIRSPELRNEILSRVLTFLNNPESEVNYFVQHLKMRWALKEFQPFLQSMPTHPLYVE